MMINSNVSLSEKEKTSFSSRILTFAATAWLGVATIGQWIFGIYILMFYGKSTIARDYEKWNEVLPHGYVAGDWKGNLVVGMHVLLAAVVVIGGPLQLIPLIRRELPNFHRWVGRIYVSTVILVATGGVIMIWQRGGLFDSIRHISISVQAIYIVSFAIIAVRYARSGRFDLHRKWALRLFMVANGVWFFRVGLMFWLLVNGGPVGFDPKTFTGPFLTTLSIFSYGIPLSLIVLEMYFYAQKNDSKVSSIATSVIIFIFTIIMAVGIFGATMGMWLPRMK